MFGQIKCPHSQTIFFVVKEAAVTGRRYPGALQLPALSVTFPENKTWLSFNGVLLSDDAMLYYNRWHRAWDCCYLAPQCCITTPVAWIRLLLSGTAVLYYNDRNVDWCCYLVPVYCKLVKLWPTERSLWDFIPHNCVADESKPPCMLCICRLLSTYTPKFRKVVELYYAGPNSLRTAENKRYTLRVKPPLSLATSVILLVDTA
jgi:hypothetical protein